MRSASLFGLLAVTPRVLRSQIAYQGASSRVEVIGLRHWSLAMLSDSIASRQHGLTLEDGTCMVVLREQLHFPDASMLRLTARLSEADSGRLYTVIKVVEPQDSARSHWIRRRERPMDRRAYRRVLSVVSDSRSPLRPERVFPALQTYHLPMADRQRYLQSLPAERRNDVSAVWRFLDGQVGGGFADTKAIAEHGTMPHRLFAVAALTRYAARDETWALLAESLRDPDPIVREDALVVLLSLTPRTIDWRPATESLRALVGGTNVGATEGVLRILVGTNITPALARTVLRDNADWILAHLRAENTESSGYARRFLVRANDGRDVGTPAAWAEWVKSL